MGQNRDKKKPYQSFGLTVPVENGNFNKALKLFKRKVKDAGILQELRNREFHEKDSTKKQRKMKAAKRRTKKLLEEQMITRKRK